MSFETSGPPDGNPGGAGNDHRAAVEGEDSGLERELQALHTAYHNFNAPLLRIRGKRAAMRAKPDIPREWKAPIGEEGAWQKIGDDEDHPRAKWDAIEKHYRAGFAVGVVPGRVGLTNIDNDTSAEVEAFVVRKIGLPHTRHDSRIRGNGKSHMWFPPLKEPRGGKWYAPGLTDAAGDIRYLGGQVVLWDPCAFAEALMLQTQCVDQTIDIAPLLVDKPKAQASSEQSDMPDLAFWQQAIPELRQVGNDPTNWEGPCPGCGEGDDRFHIKIEGERAKWGCRQCYDNLDAAGKRKRTREILDAARGPAGMGHNNPPPPDKDEEPVSDEPKPKPDLYGQIDESIIARAFLAKHGDDYLFDTTPGAWREWIPGEGWTGDKHAQAHVIAVARPIARQHGVAITPPDALTTFPNELRAMAKWCNTGPADRALKFASNYRKHAEWDKSPTLIGLPNGKVADLETGEVRDVRKDDYITRRVPIMPADSIGTRWPALVAEWAMKDAALAGYLQKLAGSCLTGINQRRIFINAGDGGNGKSVFTNAIASVIGDYAVNTPARILVGKQSYHLTFIIRLARARMMFASEPLDDETLRSSLLKEMSGGEKMTGNFMRKDPVEFYPQFTIILAANTIPDMNDVDKAMRDRTRVIPWEWQGEQDMRLNEELQSETIRAQILRWAIDGAKAFLHDRDFECAAVTAATARYMETQDSITAWLDACCKFHRDAKMPIRKGHLSYSNFCRDNGFQPKRTMDWKKRMKKLPGVTEGKGRGNVVFLHGVEYLSGARE